MFSWCAAHLYSLWYPLADLGSGYPHMPRRNKFTWSGSYVLNKKKYCNQVVHLLYFDLRFRIVSLVVSRIQYVSAVIHLWTLVMQNKLRCHAHIEIPANQITWSKLLKQIHILRQWRSRSVGFSRSQLIWTYIVWKGRTYQPGSAGQGLTNI